MFDIACPDDRDEIAEVLADAFADDPLIAWMFPHPERGTLHRHTMMEIAADAGLGMGQTYVWRDGGAIVGVAAWAPPGKSFFSGASSQRIGDLLVGASPDRLATLGAGMGEVHSYEPETPHFHLQFLGVRVARHGQGIGGRLLGACVDVIDRLGQVASLESSNERNLSVYQRNGFAVTAEVTFETIGDTAGPTVRPMLRDRPRSAATNRQ